MANKYDSAGMAIAGGLLLGLGAGFLVNNIVAGLFVGIGCGLVAAALLTRNAKHACAIKMSKDEELRIKARNRAEEKIGFYWNIGAYVVINPALLLLWFYTGRWSALGVPWFLFPLVFWGIGVLAHYWITFVYEESFTERVAEKEYQKMKKS